LDNKVFDIIDARCNDEVKIWVTEFCNWHNNASSSWIHKHI